MDEYVTLEKDKRTTRGKKETMNLRQTLTTLKFSGEDREGNHYRKEQDSGEQLFEKN